MYSAQRFITVMQKIIRLKAFCLLENIFYNAPTETAGKQNPAHSILRLHTLI